MVSRRRSWVSALRAWRIRGSQLRESPLSYSARSAAPGGTHHAEPRMLTTLSTSYTDTRAGDLAWCLGGRELPALAVLDLTLGRIPVQLRLLGASHQVMLGDTAADGRRWSETVACLPGRRTPLPAQVAERFDDWEYEFAARVESLPAHAFTARAQELLELVENHPHGLAGVFPGDPSAFTALLAGSKSGQIRW